MYFNLVDAINRWTCCFTSSTIMIVVLVVVMFLKMALTSGLLFCFQIFLMGWKMRHSKTLLSIVFDIKCQVILNLRSLMWWFASWNLQFAQVKILFYNVFKFINIDFCIFFYTNTNFFPLLPQNNWSTPDIKCTVRFSIQNCIQQWITLSQLLL